MKNTKKLTRGIGAAELRELHIQLLCVFCKVPALNKHTCELRAAKIANELCKMQRTVVIIG